MRNVKLELNTAAREALAAINGEVVVPTSFKGVKTKTLDAEIEHLGSILEALGGEGIFDVIEAYETAKGIVDERNAKARRLRLSKALKAS